jgi:hypothetical protein
LFKFNLLSVIFCGIFSLLVADVEVKEDCIFIRLRKEVVCEDKGSDKEVPSSVLVPVVEEVPVVGSEDLVFESGEAFSLERVNNISMEELYSGGQCDGSVTSSSDVS